MPSPGRNRILTPSNSGPIFFAPLANSLVPSIGSVQPTFTRATTKDYMSSAGLIAQAASGAGAFNYDVVGGTAGVSVEATAQNLLLWSGDATNAAWTKSGCSVTGGAAVGPDGVGGSAQKLVEDATNSNHRVFQVPGPGAATYVLSVYLKAAERIWAYLISAGSAGAHFNLQSGVLGTVEAGVTASITAVGNGWYRCSVSVAGQVAAGQIWAASGDGVKSYQGDGASGIYVWGSQVETGTIPSSYIPTTAGAVSRAADSLSYSSPLTGMSAVTISEWVRTPWSGAQAAANSGWFLGIGGVGHGDIRVLNNAGVLGFNLFDGASTQYGSGALTLNGTNWTANAWHHIVIQLTLTGLANMYVDGVLLVGSGQLAGWVNLTSMSSQPICPGSLNGTAQVNGDYRNLGISPRILSAGDVAAIYAAGVH